MFALLALHVLFFSSITLAIAAIPRPNRAVYFYSYLSVVLIVGGFLGNAYSLPISDGVFVSGGNLAYGAFMMTSIIFVLVERDVFILRRLILLVVSVDVFNILLSKIVIYAYTLPETVNPYAISSQFFEVSASLIALGGLLIILELTFILFCFEILKKFSLPKFVNQLAYFLVFASALVFDGVAFPLIAFGPSQEVIAITIGGLQGKILTAAFYGIALLSFTFFFPARFSKYLEERVFKWTALLSTSSQIIREMERKDEQLKEAAQLQSLAGSIAKLGSWRVSLDPASVLWSPETAKIHDEPPGTSPVLNDAINYYIPEHRARIRSAFGDCAENGRPFDENLQIVTAKGRTVWVRAIGEAVRDAAGRITAVRGAFQDITDLLAERSAAEELSHRLQRTLENISDAFFLLDDDWQFSFINRQAEVLLQRSRDDLLGKVVWEEFPDAVGSTFQTNFERVVKNDGAVAFVEYFAPLKMWVEVDVSATPEGLSVYFRDVTEQRAKAAQLRLLEAAVARQNDILLITEAEPMDGPDGPKIVYVNDAFERRTGYSRAEVMGKTPRILQGPKTQRHELDRIRKALKEWKPVRSELINYTKSGGEFWLELDIVPLADEKGWFTHWVAIERDITERKATELTIKLNEERFRTIANAAGSAIWEWNISHNTQWWGEGLKEIFGHELDPSESVPTMWWNHVHPDDAARADRSLMDLVTGKESTRVVQYRFRRSDGTWATVEDRALAIRDSEQRAVRVLGSMTDITEQKQLQERFLQAQKMETVGQLTGGVAHDFNNLLTVILGNAEILEEKLSAQPDLQRLAKMSLDAADRGAELTSRLLAFSRKQVLQPRVIDVAKLIQGMDGLLRRTLPESIDIEIIRAGGLWTIEADAPQLESALLNLAVNARDAMPDGGHLMIEASNAMLDDAYVAMEPDLKPGQYVVISVSDSGHGIPKEHLNKIFEPFFTTKEVGKGSGLGLSMVFGFVKQSGGHVRVYSETGDGTSFKLYFPRSLTVENRTEVNLKRLKPIGGSENVLVVEDDGSVRDYVTAILSGLGYGVLEASNGAQALEIIKQDVEIDLLFTDVVMPGGMGGRELAEAASAFRPGLKVLFTSGYTENSIVHHGRLDPGVKLLNKPYRREQFAAKLREVLDGKDD